jgi:hypothetical protein
MDKKRIDERRAIELLKQALSEIPHLKELRYDNQEFILWFHKVRDIIQAGLDENDRQRFPSSEKVAITTTGRLPSDDAFQGLYLIRLNHCETALQSIIQKYAIIDMDTTKSQPAKSKFSNRTLSCIIEILADSYTDSKLRTLFFKYNLLDVYEQSGRLTAKRRKVNDVFQHLCAAGDDSSRRALESIVRETLKEFYPQKEVSQIRRQRFFEKFPDLDTALRADGFHVREGELIPIISSLVEPVKEEALVETLLDKYGFSIAKNHLKQSYENYVGGNWEAANGALRSFLQDVFDQIALIIAPLGAGQKAPGGERRKLLQEKHFIESDTEAKLVLGFFQFASHKGSHPGISNESDSRLRRYMAVALASYYLEKLEGFNVRNI